MVAISVKGNKESHEYQDALTLKQIFEEAFNKTDITGQILIISNATLFGQESEGVDHLFPFCPDHQFSDHVTTEFRHRLIRNESSNQGGSNARRCSGPQITLAGHVPMKQSGQ